MGKLWDVGSAAVTTGSAIITQVGRKMDETGVTEKINTLVTTAAEKTVEAGVGLYHQGTEKFGEIKESNPRLGELTEKSKGALLYAGSAVAEVSTVLKTYCLICYIERLH